jgi:hypothetical protein
MAKSRSKCTVVLPATLPEGIAFMGRLPTLPTIGTRGPIPPVVETAVVGTPVTGARPVSHAELPAKAETAKTAATTIERMIAPSNTGVEGRALSLPTGLIPSGSTTGTTRVNI